MTEKSRSARTFELNHTKNMHRDAPHLYLMWDDEDSYGNEIWFSPAKLYEKEVTPLISSDTCREALVSLIRQALDEGKMDEKKFVFMIGKNGKKFTTAKARRKYKTFLNFINRLEAALGWVKTRVYEVTLPEAKANKLNTVWVIVASRRWMKGPPMISLYTLLLRFLSDPEVKCTTKAKTLPNLISALLESARERERHGHSDAERIIHVEDEYGLVSFFQDYSKNFGKYKIQTLLDKYTDAYGIQSFASGYTWEDD